MELLAPFAITNWRKTLGPTDPEVATSEAPNSIRAHFGTDKTYNAAHGSDSPEAAQRVFKKRTYIYLTLFWSNCGMFFNEGTELYFQEFDELLGAFESPHALSS